MTNGTVYSMKISNIFRFEEKKTWDLIHKTSHIWKTALAAALSWDAVEFTGMKHSFFAPIAAIICLQVTVEDSVLKGYSRILGIIVGVIIADLFSYFVGVHDWSIAILICISLGLATFLKFGKDAVSQVGVTALLLMTAGAGNFNYGIERIIETIIGALIAILVNMFILPPDYTKVASKTVQKAKEDLVFHLTDIAKRFKNDVSFVMAKELLKTSEKLHDDVRDAQKTVDQALHASKFSPFSKHRRSRMLKIIKWLQFLQQVYKITIEMQNIRLSYSDNDKMMELTRLEYIKRIQKLSDVVETWDENNVDLESVASEILNRKIPSVTKEE
jgi:uncharacterized membrane protein YgaE (UPF0421/DUF939 family)